MDSRMIFTRDYAAILAAITADPDDDLPRLAFADHCEEIGEVERGELVRVQLELNITPSCQVEGKVVNWGSPMRACRDVFPVPHDGKGGGPHCEPCRRFLVLRRRERQLLEAHGAEWCEWLADSLGFNLANLFRTWGCEGGAGHHWLWRRGFIEEIHAPLADWLRLSSEWLRQTPLRVYKPLKLPGERLTRPELFGNVIRLWQCENVGRLHTLDLTSIVASADAGDDDRWYPMFTSAADHAFRPWRGLKRVVIPSGGLPALAQSRRHWWEATITGIEVAFVHPVAPETAS